MRWAWLYRALRCVQAHPTEPVIVTANRAGFVSLWQLDPLAPEFAASLPLCETPDAIRAIAWVQHAAPHDAHARGTSSLAVCTSSAIMLATLQHASGVRDATVYAAAALQSVACTVELPAACADLIAGMVADRCR